MVGLVTVTVVNKIFALGVNKSKKRSPKFFTKESHVAFTKADASGKATVRIDGNGLVNGQEVIWTSPEPPEGTDTVVEVAAESIGAQVTLQSGATFENVARQAEIDSDEGLRELVRHVLEESTGWTLLFRQTAPRRLQHSIQTHATLDGPSEPLHSQSIAPLHPVHQVAKWG